MDKLNLFYLQIKATASDTNNLHLGVLIDVEFTENSNLGQTDVL